MNKKLKVYSKKTFLSNKAIAAFSLPLFFNPTNNFLFLTGSFFQFQNLFSIFWKSIASSRFENWIFASKQQYRIKIKHNTFFFLKLISTHRHLLKKNWFKMLKLSRIFKLSAKFRHFNFFNYLLRNRSLSSKLFLNSFKITNFLHNFFLSFSLKLRRKWFFLTGGMLSTRQWQFKNRRRWLRKDIQFRIIPNYRLRRRLKSRRHTDPIAPLLLNLKNKKDIFGLKKFYANNFFYLRKLKLNYSDLKFLVKLTNKKRLPNAYIWAIRRPYMFLHNYPKPIHKKTFSLHFVAKLFRTYRKLFRYLKRRNYRSKKWLNIWFKELSYKKPNKTTKKIFRNWRFFRKFFKTRNRLLPFYRASFYFSNSSFPITSFSARKLYLRKTKKIFRNKMKLILRLKKMFRTRFKRNFKSKNVRILRTSLKRLTRKKYRVRKHQSLSLKKTHKLFFISKRFREKFNFYLRRKYKRYFKKKIKVMTLKFLVILRFKKIKKNLKKLNYLKSLARKIRKSRRYVRFPRIFFKKFKKIPLLLFKLNTFTRKQVFKRKFKRIATSVKPILLNTNTSQSYPVSSFKWKSMLSKTKFLFIFKNLSLFLKKKSVFSNKVPKLSRPLQSIPKRFRLIKIKSFVFKFLKKPVVLNRYRNPFISPLGSFVRLTNALVLNQSAKRSNLTHFIKKILFSFSEKNELQRYILRKYVRNRIVLSTYRGKRRLRRFKRRSIPRFLFNTNFSKIDENSLFAPVSTIKSLLIKNFTSLAWLDNRTQAAGNIMLKKNSISPYIKRIKFKPGYMRIWRTARKTLQQILNLNFRYQYKLTNYLSKYKKFLNFKFYVNFEMQLLNILVRSKLVPDHQTAESFIVHGLTYVNGLNCYNPKYQIYVGDFIQLIVNLKYYIMYRWLLNWLLRRRARLRKLSRTKFSFRKRRHFKKKSYSYPRWILFSKNTVSDVAKFLEVDYLTLSVFVLYEPFLWTDLNPHVILGLRFGVINLYNWKYIT